MYLQPCGIFCLWRPGRTATLRTLTYISSPLQRPSTGARRLLTVRCVATRMQASTGPRYCVPSDGICCAGCSWRDGICYDGECEGLSLAMSSNSILTRSSVLLVLRQPLGDLPAKHRLVVQASTQNQKPAAGSMAGRCQPSPSLSSQQARPAACCVQLCTAARMNCGRPTHAVKCVPRQRLPCTLQAALLV